MKRRETEAAKEYRRKFPLDTPGRFYDNIADRIRAGEPERDVLHDFGLWSQDECLSVVPAEDYVAAKERATELEKEIARLKARVAELEAECE